MLDIDSDVIATGMALAVARKETVGKVLSDFARRSLWPATVELERRRRFPCLPKRRGVTVTPDLVGQFLGD